MVAAIVQLCLAPICPHLSPSPAPYVWLSIPHISTTPACSTTSCCSTPFTDQFPLILATLLVHSSVAGIPFLSFLLFPPFQFNNYRPAGLPGTSPQAGDTVEQEIQWEKERAVDHGSRGTFSYIASPVLHLAHPASTSDPKTRPSHARSPSPAHSVHLAAPPSSL